MMTNPDTAFVGAYNKTVRKIYWKYILNQSTPNAFISLNIRDGLSENDRFWILWNIRDGLSKNHRFWILWNIRDVLRENDRFLIF